MVHSFQPRVTTATAETLREANRVVALDRNDAERSIVYKVRLPWGTGEFCDASFVGELGINPSVAASITDVA